MEYIPVNEMQHRIIIQGRHQIVKAFIALLHTIDYEFFLIFAVKSIGKSIVTCKEKSLPPPAVRN